ncbi:hypothetical protein JHK82_041844 [Glycine max]|nr:hypothetical protein JHK82_041844 [Glycine max]
MFGFSRRHMKLGRLKVQLSDTTQGTRSPIRHHKRNGDRVAGTSGHSEEIDCPLSSAAPEMHTCTAGSSENWMVLSIAGNKPTPRSHHAAAVIQNKMIVVGGESGSGLLDGVQVLNFDRFSWTTASSKLYLSPSSLPLKIPACKGHCLVARSGHTVVMANSVLILFGGEDAKRRKLNDLHMFDLKSLTWLPLHCTGAAPCPRFNHVAALYDGHGETLVYDVVKSEWSVAITSPPSSITTNKGFSVALVQHKDKDFLVAFGGSKKEPSNQVEVLITEKIESVLGRRPTSTKDPRSILLEKHSLSAGLASQLKNDSSQHLINSVARQNLASVIEHSSERKSLSESLLVQDSNSLPTNISLRRQFDHDEECNADVRIDKHSEDESSFPRAADHKTNQNDPRNHMSRSGAKTNMEEQVSVSRSSNQKNLGFGNPVLESDDVSFPENSKSGSLSAASDIHHYYETKVASLMRKFGILEGQLAVALASREASEKSLASAFKSRQEMERKLADTLKEMELLREKLVSAELVQEEANNLSNMVHADNVRLEHDVAFLKAVLDDTQKELHSTRGVLAAERTRAFQLQVEVFHLKQRLQSMEKRAPTPRKPFQV